MSEPTTRSSDEQSANEQAERHDPVYDELSRKPEFIELRKAYRGFVIPATVGFLSWYLLYVVLSNWADGFMAHRLIGNINVALVFGLLQFLTTFLLAWLYSRYSTSRLDPLAREVQADYEREER